MIGRPWSDFEIAPRLAAMAQDGFDMQVLIFNNPTFYYVVNAAMGARSAGRTTEPYRES